MDISQNHSIMIVSALDKLLAQALASIIKTKLGLKTYQKIEARLQERYGLSIAESIKEFYKLDATLREFFGAGVDALEGDILNHLISLDTSSKSNTWITIEYHDLANLILEAYGDREKRIILDAALKKPGVVLDILESCNIPKSSGYRIVSQLVDDGLLTEEGYDTTSDGKKVTRYTALFENVKIDVEKGGVVVRVLLKVDILRESYLVKTLLELHV